MLYIKYKTEGEAKEACERIFNDANNLNMFASGTLAYAIPEKEEYWKVPILPGFEQFFLESEFKKSEIIEKGYHSITPTQGRILLKRRGLLNTINQMIELSDDEALKIYWEYSLSWDRSHSYIQGLAAQLAMSETDLDEFFIEASQIQ